VPITNKRAANVIDFFMILIFFMLIFEFALCFQ
jgi:hypothetical protein